MNYKIHIFYYFVHLSHKKGPPKMNFPKMNSPELIFPKIFGPPELIFQKKMDPLWKFENKAHMEHILKGQPKNI